MPPGTRNSQPALGRRTRGALATSVLALALTGIPRPATAVMSAPERAAILAPTTEFASAERWESLSGGSASNRTRFDREAFSQPSASLTFAGRARFAVGDGLFRRPWVSAPASTTSADGLGPLYNARSCQRCHLKDGRGHPPEGPRDSAVSMFLRLSVPPRSASERAALARREVATLPEPTYGGQLQDLALPGHAPEGRMRIDYAPLPVHLAGGEVVDLREPRYRVESLAYGPMAPDVMLSPRVAPPMIGLGLLEAIEEADIVARADPDDGDGDGVSGRPNFVYSASSGKVMLGRFGWKAGKATIPDQAAAAMAGDIGVSNPLAPEPWGDCTVAQAACRTGPHGADPTPGSFEAPAEVMEAVAFYSRNLAVPARRDSGEAGVLRGKALFYRTGCIACHTPKHATRGDWPEPALAGQLIWPYTDLLLHDMGEGLADGRPEGEANGREWRTPPLWGIGLTETVNSHRYFLHDGRARGLLEAILWHGGEAGRARDAFRALPPEDRAALVRFLESL